MKNDIETSIKLIDRKNPGFGYDVTITDAVTGAIMFKSEDGPDGPEGRTVRDCIYLIEEFMERNGY